MTEPTFQRRYTFKLYPTTAQSAAMAEQYRMVAALWNAMMERQETTYRRTRGQRGVLHADGQSHLTYYDLTAEVTALRQACPEWEALSVWTGHRVARAMTDAFKAFFRRAKAGAGASAGYPRYRAARRANWLPHRFASGCRMTRRSGRNWRLTLKGVPGEIKVRGKLPLEPIKWTDADIREQADGVWLSVGVEVPQRRQSGVGSGKVRFDLIDSFAGVTRTDGGRTAGPERAWTFRARDGRICASDVRGASE